MRVHAVTVEVVAGPDVGTRIVVDRPAFVVGTGEGADLRLTDDTVSRQHVRLLLSQAGIRVRDEGSTNGTWIHGIRVTDVLLTSSVTITLGSTSLALHIDAATLDLPLAPSESFGDAVGGSAAMRHLFAVLERAAPSDVTVLIEGESGTGKELLAHGVHLHSDRAGGPFVAIDCGAIPANLLESELFGHERGAFTGADRARVGAFEQANGGTLFLDEIGELPIDLQPKLLRALEMRQIRPLGGHGVRSINVRIVAATNRNLADASKRQEFRVDLYYRLAVVRVTVPPLRDRSEDILPLATHLLRRLHGFEEATLPPDLAAMLSAYKWPGNVRELRNVMDRYAVLGANPAALFDGSVPTRPTPVAEDLSHLPYHEARQVALDRFERSYVPAVLERAGNIVVRAAELAQVGRTSFHRMIQRIRSNHIGDD
ncbi:Response regulator of zinc sigma-54-dependent two-component system [Labilithrix luteola]|uniref:Response regulator of zinc sigma-54-dependent two-component system n=1 Tax=Labilithrix luteola TaxID=1391654 RepID=A0A0K1PUT4_9BACT|nr:Response regulator of zinc sigma-54-dependent two-component system [Labilithrix luteola]